MSKLRYLAELVAKLEILTERYRSLLAENAQEDAVIAARKEAWEEHFSNLHGVTWKWGDPSPLAVEEFEEWLAQRKPDYVRTRFKRGDPPRSVISHPVTGVAISVPENRLADLEIWEAEGRPSNSPATR
jgi:hypothetical protein